VSGCGRRAAILYGGLTFACRHCHKLVYASQRENWIWRAQRRVRKLKKRLGWEKEDGGRPKGMHRRTFERLKNKHDLAETIVWRGLAAEFEDVWRGLL
jgi:hypothetical protein